MMPSRFARYGNARGPTPRLGGVTPLDNLMRPSESRLPHKQMFYAAQKQTRFTTRSEVWRQPERQVALRMEAIIGAMKLATQTSSNQSGCKKPMAELFCEALASLKSEP